jgi:hypothetical protein
VTEIVDPIAAVSSVLLADADVAALAGVRVYGGAVPDTAKTAMPQACVVVKPAGGAGAGEGYMQWGRSRVDTYCYGASLHEAWNVYLAVYGALKQLQRQVADGVLLHSAAVLSKGALGVDPETQWPVTLASFSVTASEVAAV